MKKSLLLASSLALALGVGAAVGARQTKVLEAKAYDNTNPWFVTGTFSGWSEEYEGMPLTYNKTNYDEYSTAYFEFYNTTPFVFHEDDEFKFINPYGGGTNWKGVRLMDANNPSGMTCAGIDANVIVSKDVKATLYFSMNGDGSYTKLYWEEVKSTVTVHSNSNEYGTASASKTSLSYGETTTLTATPIGNSTFTGWKLNDTIVSTDNPYTTPAIHDDCTYTAVFAPEHVVEYKVTIGSNEYELVEADQGDHDAQYSVRVDADDIVMGAAISFTADGAALSVDPDDTNSNNVHRPTNKVLETSANDVDLWLKKDGANWTYWLGGRNGHYFIVNGSNFVPLAENENNPGEYYTTGLNLVKDSTVKLYVTTNYDGKVKAGSQGASVQGGVITVDETGNYDLYYEPGADNYIYFQQNHSYTVEFGIHEPVTLNEVDKGDYDAQYKATIEVSAGDVLSFKRDGVALTVGEDSTNQHNVFVPQHKVIESGTVDVYLKKSGDNWTYWLAGRTATYYLYTNASFVPLMVNPNNANEVYATNVAMAANATVQIYEKVDAEDPTLNTHVDEEVAVVAGGHIKVVTANSYNVYYNFSEKSLYIGNLSDADRAANTYADLFLETLSTGAEAVCEASGDTDPAKLATAWASLKTAFENIAEDNQVKEDAQGILKDANPNADTKVGHFAKLYDFIVHKYGSEAREDFVNRFNGAVVPPLSNSFTSPLFENNGGLVIVVVVATVAAISAGLFFILKKKETK